MIKFSCNGAIANWALQTEDTLFRSTLEALHFGSTWNIGLRGEIRGLLQPASSWSGRSKPTIAFGQEIGVTALQMASAATAIANKGVLVSPSIIRSVHSHDGKVNPDVVVPRSTTRVLSETTAENILHYMETATEPGGTARLTAIEGVRIASKTGTAQILDEETNSYDSSNFLASTLSIFPVEDPQYIRLYRSSQSKREQRFGEVILLVPRLHRLSKAYYGKENCSLIPLRKLCYD